MRAVKYWKIRYNRGNKGGLWTERAKQHLVGLSEKFPRLKREFLEEEALELSKNVVLQRRKEDEEKIKQAKVYLDTGKILFKKGEYQQARGEFQKVLEIQIDSQNKEIRGIIDEARKFYTRSLKQELVKRASFSLQQSLSYFERGDYLSALQELKKAERLIPEIPRK